MTTLVFTEGDWSRLAETLGHSVESAAVVVARIAHTSPLTLLVRSVHLVGDADYLRRTSSELEIASPGYIPFLQGAADDGSVAIFFHSHPAGEPTPSARDLRVDSSLAEPFRLRTGTDFYGSLILAGSRAAPSFSGRILSRNLSHDIQRIRVVGNRLRLLTKETHAVDSEMFDRQIRAFGVAGQAVLGSLRVGVVGAGGTGSAVFEQLVRLGVGDVLLADDDDITASNIARIHETGVRNIGTKKVSALRAAARRIGSPTRVRIVPKRITDRQTALQFRDRDIIFGCTDDNAGRAVLSRLAYWYMVPVIDTGFVVDINQNRVRGLFGRVTIVQPGHACLWCRNRLDLNLLRSETLNGEERSRLAGEGYVPGLGEPDPSVGTYTGLVAHLAVHELLSRLFGFSDNPPHELLMRVHEETISRLGGQPNADHYCSDPSTWGRGDTEPFLEQLWSE